MTSINTNIAAQTALRTLQSTNAQLDQTQNRISTGLKISEARDNAAYWSISTSMKSDNKSLGTVKDSLSLGAGAVDTAYQGTQNVLNVLDDIKSKITAASGAAADRDAIQLEIAELNKQLVSYVKAAVFAGENWLDEAAEGANTSKTVVSGFTRENIAAREAQDAVPATGTEGQPGYVPGTPAVEARDASTSVSLTNIEIDTSKRLLGAEGVLGSAPADGVAGDNSSVLQINLKADSFDAEALADVLNLVETAITAVKGQAATFGAIASRIELQQSFVTNLIDTIDKGISGLIDADMNEESTRLQALQVKQQLGVQALSIANQSAQNVLRLFQ